MKKLIAVAMLLCSLPIITAPASAQSCLRVINCPEDQIAVGDPPDCSCQPIVSRRGPPTCEANFGCADARQVAAGDWPDCRCRSLETPVPDRGSGRGPQPGVDFGGTATCDAFFDCPTGFEMTVIDARCLCQGEMLPAFE